MSSLLIIRSNEKPQVKARNVGEKLEDETLVRIEFLNNGKLRSCGTGLEQNSKVTKLEITIENSSASYVYDYDNAARLMDFVRTSENLESVECYHIKSESFVRSFLQSAAHNSNIEEIMLNEIPDLNAMVEMLLKESKSMKRLTIGSSFNCWVSKADVDLSAAFLKNKSLERLEMSLWNFQQDSFRVLSGAIKQSASLNTLILCGCSFDMPGTKALLELVCHKETNIQELGIECCSFENKDSLESEGYCLGNEDCTSFALKVMESKSQTSKFRKLNLSFDGITAKELLRPFIEYGSFSKPKVECVQLTYYGDDDECIFLHDLPSFKEFVSVLPNMRGMNELVLHLPFLHGRHISDKTTSILVDALWKNHCLKYFRITNANSETIMSNNRSDMLRKRNEIIQSWKKSRRMSKKYYLYRVVETCLQHKN